MLMMLMMLTLVMTKLVFKILTEQSIPENPGSQTQVFMFEHFWVVWQDLQTFLRE